MRRSARALNIAALSELLAERVVGAVDIGVKARLGVGDVPFVMIPHLLLCLAVKGRPLQCVCGVG
jgi:hypothetical protein